MALTQADVERIIIKAVEELILPKFQELDTKITKLDKRMSKVEDRIDSLELRLGRRMDILAGVITDVRADHEKRLVKLEEQNFVSV